MTDHDEHLSEEYVKQLREAVEAVAAGETDWTAFHGRLNAAVAARLADLRRRVPAGYRAAGAAWWDYAARAGLAALPLGLVAALLLFTYLRSSDGNANDAQPLALTAPAAAGNADAARAAFESVLTGVAAPQAVIGALIPVPAAAFLADSTSGGGR
jgi:hypothetical protein